jgi:holo-[acyl-carrier protein] synthase
MIGIDIVSIARIEKLINKFGKKAKKRFMTKNEQLSILKIDSIAGIWAFKEAFSKAIGTGIGKDFSFLDVEIYKNRLGKPKIKIKNKKLKKRLKNYLFDLSITHDGGFAIGVVILVKKGKK